MFNNCEACCNMKVCGSMASPVNKMCPLPTPTNKKCGFFKTAFSYAVKALTAIVKKVHRCGLLAEAPLTGKSPDELKPDALTTCILLRAWKPQVDQKILPKACLKIF